MRRNAPKIPDDRAQALVDIMRTGQEHVAGVSGASLGELLGCGRNGCVFAAAPYGVLKASFSDDESMLARALVGPRREPFLPVFHGGWTIQGPKLGAPAVFRFGVIHREDLADFEPKNLAAYADAVNTLLEDGDGADPTRALVEYSKISKETRRSPASRDVEAIRAISGLMAWGDRNGIHFDRDEFSWEEDDDAQEGEDEILPNAITNLGVTADGHVVIRDLGGFEVSGRGRYQGDRKPFTDAMKRLKAGGTKKRNAGADDFVGVLRRAADYLMETDEDLVVGGCGDVTAILAEFSRRLGHGARVRAVYGLAGRRSPVQHAWLEVDRRVFDPVAWAQDRKAWPPYVEAPDRTTPGHTASIRACIEGMLDAGDLNRHTDELLAALGLTAVKPRLESNPGPFDDYLYSVTYFNRLGSIAEHGLVPNAPEGVGRGGNRSHSEGRVFLTHCDGVFFWHSRYQDHADHQSDDVLEDGLIPVVVRLPRSAVKHELHEDPHGVRDALRPAWFVEGKIPPDEIEVWTGATWALISDWEEIDPTQAFDSEEDPDEPGRELHWWKNSEPLRPRCGSQTP